MKSTNHHVLNAIAIVALAAASCLAIQPGAIIVTAEKSGASDISQHDVVAKVGNQPATVTAWHPVPGNAEGLELWILIDDGTNSQIGVQLKDIRDFIRQQPAQTKIAIGYLQNGTVRTAQQPTTDRDAAGRALRLPLTVANISASPYIALGDFLHGLTKKVPAVPREVVFISSGIDPYYGPGPQNPYLESAIRNAQKLGVPVNTIYFSSAGIQGRRYWLIEWGQNDLSQLANETGGRFYWEGDRNPVALKPYFDDLNRRLAEQYLVELDTSGARSGFEALHLTTESPQIKLIGPAQIYTH